MVSLAGEIWKNNPTELAVGAVFYASSFCILKYLRRDKAPAKLTNVKLLYNAVMSVFSLYIFQATLWILIQNYRNSTASENPFLCDNGLELFNGMEWYFKVFYYSKYVEFADTFFLVMAGVANSSTKMTLHLYHHLVTPSIVYATWFYPCMGGWCGPVTNGFVHVVMYAYYGLSVICPSIKKYGNIVTYIQLTQFVGVIGYHLFYILPRCWDCSCNRYQLAYNFLQYSVFLGLFSLFLAAKNKGKAVRATTANGHGQHSLKKE